MWQKIQTLFSKDWIEGTRERPYVKKVAIGGKSWFEWTCQILPSDEGDRKGAVLHVAFFDRTGKAMSPPETPGWLSSEQYPMFKYLDTRDAGSGERRHIIRAYVPAGATQVQIGIVPWRSTPRLLVSSGGSFYWASVPANPTRDEQVEQSVDREIDHTASLEIESARATALRALIVRLDRKVEAERAGVVVVKFYDADGEIEEVGKARPFLEGGVGYFRYLDGGGGSDFDNPNVFLFTPPLGVTRMEFEVREWDWKEGKLLAASLELVEEPDIKAALSGLPDCRNKWRAFADLHSAFGDPVNAEAALTKLLKIAPNRNVAREHQNLNAVLTELQSDWVPGGGNTPVSCMPNTRLKRANGLRVCHLMKVSQAFENSGGAVRNYRTVKYQSQHGVQPYVILPLGYPWDSYRETSEVGGVPHFHLPLGGLSPSHLISTSALELEVDAATPIVERMGVDIVHATSGYRGYDTALKGMALAKRFGVPLVYEVRSFHEHTWGSKIEAVDAPLTQMRMQKELFCMQQADHVITISNAMVEELSRRGIPKDKISVIPNAVDDDFVTFVDDGQSTKLREQLGWADKTIIGYISNISAREGHSVLIDALRNMLESGDDVRCLIVGDGRGRAELEDYCMSQGLAGKVSFTGEIDHAQVQAYYKAIDYFVVPRLPDYAADFVTPMKPFEAMALEVPLVMSNRPVAREILGSEERGWSFETGDPADLARVLSSMIANPSEVAVRVEAALDWVLTQRQWKYNSAKFSEIYERVAAKR